MEINLDLVMLYIILYMSAIKRLIIYGDCDYM